MNASQFAWWLHGYDEINGQKPDARQWQIIMDHLAIVDEVKHLYRPEPPKIFVATGYINPPQERVACGFILSGQPPQGYLQRGTIEYC